MFEKTQIDSVKNFGRTVDFGRAASDYSFFRAGFLERFFERLAAQIELKPGLQALDIAVRCRFEEYARNIVS